MIELDVVTKQFVLRSGLSHKIVHAVTDTNLKVVPGETISIVGESGCGKSTLGRIVAGLIAPTSGTLRWDGQPVDRGKKRDFLRYQLAVQIVHQDPYAALNPVRKVGAILAEPLVAHRIVERQNVHDRVFNILRQVGLDPDAVVPAYPHQLSGGQRQRILIARALTVEPQFLVADEAVSMVDVSQRLGILELFKSIMLQRRLGLVFITHDFRVARYIAWNGQIAVMYLGQIVEYGLTDTILHHPIHPYTRCLLTAVPLLRGKESEKLGGNIVPKSYEVPDAVNIPEGCSFEPRCPYAISECRTKRPILQSVPEPGSGSVHQVACHLSDSIASGLFVAG